MPPLKVITAERAERLLRGGADVHAAARQGAPTPLDLAREMRAAGADMVLPAESFKVCQRPMLRCSELERAPSLARQLAETIKATRHPLAARLRPRGSRPRWPERGSAPAAPRVGLRESGVRAAGERPVRRAASLHGA